MTKVVRKRLAEGAAATSSRIDKFIEETSNRLLCTVVFGQLGIGEESLRSGLADVFELRNRLVHGKQYQATREETQAALDGMEKLFDLGGIDIVNERMTRPG